MVDIRNYEELKKKIEEDIRYYENRIELWKRVEIVTKKDGTPYKNFNQNFKNADVGKYYPVEDWANPYLTVADHFRNSKGHWEWFDDHMEIYVIKYNKRLPEHNEEREVRHWCGQPREVMTFDEIRSEIDHRIAELEEHKKQCEEDLARSEMVFAEAEKEVDKIKEIISGEEGSSLKYGIKEYILESIKRTY